MKSKKIISLAAAAALLLSMLPGTVSAEEAGISAYSCDFAQLVQSGADTAYGTSDDIIALDGYTTAHLTYEGTYVGSDGTVHLTGSTNKTLANCSYIEFTAPADGTVSYTGTYISYYIDGKYSSYSDSASVTLVKGQTFQMGYRSGKTAITSLTFTPSETSDGEGGDPAGDETPEYAPPQTTWSFDSAPPADGKNLPVMGGNAVWANGETQFPASDTKTGTLTVDMENPIRNNVTIEFDAIDHVKPLGQQYFNIVIGNSEETIVDFQAHPYSDDYGKGFSVCGETIAEAAAVRAAWGGVGTHHIRIDIDYSALTVKAAVGDTEFDGNIPEGTVSDFKKLEISSNRSKTAADRYISVDNLKIEEFDSVADPADITVADGYTEKTIAGVGCRVKPQEGKPAVIYLASELRMGTDGYSQLYDAKPLFDLLSDGAALIAPQTDGIFSDIAPLVSEVRAMYSTPSVAVVGQSQNTAAALSSGADKIITIAGTGDTTPANGSVWAFSGHADEEVSVADTKTMVNRLQRAGIDTRYTEYPYDGHKINEKAAAQTADWILSGAADSKTVDLAVFMGQSNMAGRGDYEDAAECKPGHGFEYHSVTEPGVITTVSEPFGKYENNDTVNDSGSNGIDRRSGDMVSAFMESYYQTSGTPIVGVQCSRGGTASSYWRGGVLAEAAIRYKEAEEYLADCGYTIGKKFMVWCQGESDADNGVSAGTYKSNTKEIFETMKTNAGISDMFMVRIGHCKTSGAAAIDEIKDARYKRINLAQKELSDETEGITAVASFYTDEYADLMRDQYHYYQPAYNSIGAVAGNNTAYTLYGTGAWTAYSEPEEDIEATPMPVENFEITSSSDSVDVSALTMYDNTSYRVYKPDGSYETEAAQNGRIPNNSGGEVTIVPEYKFEFTNQTSPTDEHIKDRVKVGADSYTEEKGFGLVAGGNYDINENGCYIKDYPIKIDLPEGFYDIEIYRKGGARADVYANGIQIINNTTSASPQNRSTGSALMFAPGIRLSGGASFTFGNLSGSGERIASIKITRVPEKYRKPVIWIAGDSESANYFAIDADGDDLKSDKIMMTGFGMQLGKFLSDKYSIANWGQPSATVKTWYDECFESVSALIRAGDTLLIDFGINDAISSSNKITADEMKHCMEDIITAAKAKGAAPILISPVYNSKYQSKSYFTYSAESGNAMYKFASDCGVPCIDLNKGGMLYTEDAIAATGDGDWVRHNYHIADNLHQTQHSALLNAAIIAGGMKAVGYETTDYSYTYKDISDFDAEDSTKRGAESGASREYSVAALEKYVTVNGADISATEPAGTPANKPTDEPAGGIETNGETVTVTLPGRDSAALVRVSKDGSGKPAALDAYTLALSDGRASVDIAGLAASDELYVWNSLDDMEPLLGKTTAHGAAEKPAETSSAPTVSTAPTATAATEEAKTMIYSQNFESFSLGDGGGWTSPAGFCEIREDSENGIGKYLVKGTESGKNGTCRSAYFELPSPVAENFVFECDYRSTSNANVADLELLENKSSVYANHGVYSNKNYAFTMAKPKSENRYVINNRFDDSGAALSSYAAPVFVTDEIAGDPWIHVKVAGDMGNQTVYVTLTSIDGKTVYHSGKYDMNVGRDGRISSWKCVHILGHSSAGDTGIDNIEVYKARESDLSEVYHTAVISCGSESFSQYVKDGGSVVNIPDTSAYGEYFEGWSVGGEVYSTERLSQLGITSDCEITAMINPGYIEALASVDFRDFPAGGELVMGADENTYGDNSISLSIIGEHGTSLVTAPDIRVSDYRVDWTFDGFRTLDGTPTGETGANYCDSYGLIEITETAQTSVNFKLKRTAANYYGRVRATVTYNGRTVTVEKPLVLRGDKSAAGFLPKPGYPSDFNKFEDSMVGCQIKSGDALSGGWATAGSDASYMHIASDSSGKYLRLSRAASGNSSYIYNEIGAITKQTVFEQDIRFGIDGSIKYIGGSVTSPSSTAFTFAKSGTNLTFNGETIYGGMSANDWYHITITADPTTKLTFAKVCDMSGTLLGESGIVDFGTYSSGAYYEISPSKSNKGSIDINNVRIYEEEISADSFVISMPETAEIPESGEEKIYLSASALTVGGDKAIGLVKWSISDELAEDVTIESAGNDSAELIIRSGAAPGYLPIRAEIGGKSAEAQIKLIGTRENAAFVSAPAGIPLGKAEEYIYAAEVRDGNAETVSGRTVTYSLADRDGRAADYEGVSVDPASGVLSISEAAKPCVIYVKASAAGSGGDEITRLARTVLYDLKFRFGSGAAPDGFTNVTSDTAYSGSLGFGIEGGARDEEDCVSGSGFTFKIKLEKGRVYDVKAKYEGTIRCERIDSNLVGFDRSLSAMGEDSWQTAIFGDGVMDITLPSEGRLVAVEITPVEKTAAQKPDWWTIGDSTVQQNGSWGYTIAATDTEDLSEYPELAAVVNGFHNSGKAGEQHKSFCANGRLNAVLTRMSPGDVVSISGMGTNDSSSTKEDFKSYDEAYMNAILDMGGKVILGSYTPTGNYGATQGRVYDADTMMFKGMRTNAYDLAIREVYEENKTRDGVLGFIDIGKLSDEKMTDDVRAAYAAAKDSGAADKDARAAADARAEELMSWWKDYNHYYTEFSNYILPDITKAAADLIAAR